MLARYVLLSFLMLAAFCTTCVFASENDDSSGTPKNVAHSIKRTAKDAAHSIKRESKRGAKKLKEDFHSAKQKLKESL